MRWSQLTFATVFKFWREGPWGLGSWHGMARHGFQKIIRIDHIYSSLSQHVHCSDLAQFFKPSFARSWPSNGVTFFFFTKAWPSKAVKTQQTNITAGKYLEKLWSSFLENTPDQNSRLDECSKRKWFKQILQTSSNLPNHWGPVRSFASFAPKHPVSKCQFLSDILNVHRRRRFYTSLEYVSYQCLGSTPPPSRNNHDQVTRILKHFLGLGISICHCYWVWG